MVDTDEKWIVDRTGIHERGLLEEDQSVSHIALSSIKNMVEEHAIDTSDIDAIFFCTSTPDYNLSSTAAYVASKIGATSAFGFDLNSACSGYLYGLSVGSKYIESGRYQKVLVIGADKMSAMVNYKDRNTCIIFGDGGGVALLEPELNGNGIQDEKLRVDGNERDLLYCPAGGSVEPASSDNVNDGRHFLHQNGRKVYARAVSEMSAICAEILDKNNYTVNDIDWLVSHQANSRIIESVQKRVGLPESKVLTNISHAGNTTNGTIPLLIDDFKDKFKEGDLLLITTFGAGFSWGSMLMRWGCLHTS